MRATYAIVGLVITAGVIAFFSMSGPDGESDGEPPAKKAGTGVSAKPALPGKKPISLKRDTTVAAPSPANAKAEVRAQDLLRKLAEAQSAGRRAEAQALRQTLRSELWDTAAARRDASARGRALLAQASTLQGTQRVTGLDRARRLMSRGVFLPEMFTKANADTAERTQLIAAIQAANRVVMIWGTAVPGVTQAYKITPGMTPARIVYRKDIVRPEPLSLGPNAVMYWNQNGNLDPSKLRAGRRFMLPLEELTVEVHKQRFRLAVFIGDWFVKEWPVGVGMVGKDTPVGNFVVHSKEENPVWYAPNGRTIHPGTAANELGARWIAIHDPVHGALALEDGIGIHGTPKPKTVGTRCSNGCVRLTNAAVKEVFWWVRTGNGGAQPTRIFIRP